MGHSLTTNDYILGLGQDICDGFNKNFKNPTIHKVPGQPDVYLISKEGVRVKVHKQLIFSQTPFLRQVLRSATCPNTGSSETMTHVSLPDVNLYVLKVVIEFLSTGILKCYAGQEKEVKKVLVKVFGIPPKIFLSQVCEVSSEIVPPESPTCLICKEENILIKHYFSHLWTHVTDELEEIKDDLETGDVLNVECLICKKQVTPPSDVTSPFEYVREHYMCHRKDLRTYIKKAHGYNVTDSEDKTVSNADEPSSENDEMEDQQDNHETAQSHQQSFIGGEATVDGFAATDSQVIPTSTNGGEHSMTCNRESNNGDQFFPYSSSGDSSTDRDDIRQNSAPTKNASTGRSNKKRKKILSRPLITSSDDSDSSVDRGKKKFKNSNENIRLSNVSATHQANLPIPDLLLQQDHRPRQQLHDHPADKDNLFCRECDVAVRKTPQGHLLENHSFTHYLHIFDSLIRNVDGQFPCPRCTVKKCTTEKGLQQHLVATHGVFKEYLKKQNLSIEDLYYPNEEDIYGPEILDPAPELLEGDPSAEHQVDPEREMGGSNSAQERNSDTSSKNDQNKKTTGTRNT